MSMQGSSAPGVLSKTYTSNIRASLAILDLLTRRARELTPRPRLDGQWTIELLGSSAEPAEGETTPTHSSRAKVPPFLSFRVMFRQGPNGLTPGISHTSCLGLLILS